MASTPDRTLAGPGGRPRGWYGHFGCGAAAHAQPTPRIAVALVERRAEGSTVRFRHRSLHQIGRLHLGYGVRSRCLPGSSVMPRACCLLGCSWPDDLPPQALSLPPCPCLISLRANVTCGDQSIPVHACPAKLVQRTPASPAPAFPCGNRASRWQGRPEIRAVLTTGGLTISFLSPATQGLVSEGHTGSTGPPMFGMGASSAFSSAGMWRV
mmetsp:Transcript_69373/g.122501  ORF Transcript_69373/g.122501 Transcript_69373/m.122501 type:complete len:211 (+) Transcript_69373:1261-1893(+)